MRDESMGYARAGSWHGDCLYIGMAEWSATHGGTMVYQFRVTYANGMELWECTAQNEARAWQAASLYIQKQLRRFQAIRGIELLARLK